MIKISEISKTLYEVTVNNDGESKHLVTLTEKDYKNISGKKVNQIELIEASFIFLMERESNQSILREFNITIIQKYFPEYTSVIQSYFK